MTDTGSYLRVSDEGGIRIITIDRPEARNALTAAMRHQLCDVLSAAERDASTRVVILTGTDPAFTAGVDFTEGLSQDGWNAYDAQFVPNPGRALRAMSTPVICAVNGACISGGLEIALSAAFVIGSERATFADTHARLGAVATWGLTALLPRAVGIRKAREMSITGQLIDAEEAFRLGLVNHVVPHEVLMDFTLALASGVADGPAVAETMRLYQRTGGLTLSEALALEAEYTSRREFDPVAFERAGRRVTGHRKDLSPSAREGRDIGSGG